MKDLKAIGVWMFLLMLAGSLAGCPASDDSDDGMAEQPTNQPVSATFEAPVPDYSTDDWRGCESAAECSELN
ncbi:MAG: hypothetical protein ACR2PJ_00710 [Pseudomonadales bacterium]